jgi:hypothetical protein
MNDWLIHITDYFRYCNLKDEALDHTLWRTNFGRGYDLSQDRLYNELYIPMKMDLNKDCHKSKMDWTRMRSGSAWV